MKETIPSPAQFKKFGERVNQLWVSRTLDRLDFTGMANLHEFISSTDITEEELITVSKLLNTPTATIIPKERWSKLLLEYAVAEIYIDKIRRGVPVPIRINFVIALATYLGVKPTELLELLGCFTAYLELKENAQNNQALTKIMELVDKGQLTMEELSTVSELINKTVNKTKDLL